MWVNLKYCSSAWVVDNFAKTFEVSERYTSIYALVLETSKVLESNANCIARSKLSVRPSAQHALNVSASSWVRVAATVRCRGSSISNSSTLQASSPNQAELVPALAAPPRSNLYAETEWVFSMVAQSRSTTKPQQAVTGALHRPLEIRLLGCLEFSRNGCVLPPLAIHKTQPLLAYLLLNRNRYRNRAHSRAKLAAHVTACLRIGPPVRLLFHSDGLSAMLQAIRDAQRNNAVTRAFAFLKSPAAHRLFLIGMAVLATLAVWLWSLHVRQFLGRGEWAWSNLAGLLNIHPFGSAVSIQALAVPLILVYLFSRTRLFRRFVSGESKPGDGLKLFGALALLQLLALSYGLWLFYQNPDQTVIGLFIVLVGGFLGGWRMGLGLGLLSALISGTVFTAIETGGSLFGDFLFIITNPNPGFIFEYIFAEMLPALLPFYLINLRAGMAIWAGLMAGVAGDGLGERRFAPGVMGGLGIVIELGAGILIMFTVERPLEFAGLLASSALATGLALGAAALVIREVQSDGARRKAEQAELARAHAELRALRAQINPHFLFNALNTIRYFVRTDPETARRLLLNLSDVFQRTIRSGDAIPLHEELSCVQAYLSLEQARLGERLQIIWEGEGIEPDALHQAALLVAAPRLLAQPVPTLILQPIVENAVIHGISKKPEGGTVRITVQAVEHDLVLQVVDNGVGIEPTRVAELLKPPAEGDTRIGLHNVDARLRAFYGPSYGLAIESEVGQGTRVKMRIPVSRMVE